MAYTPYGETDWDEKFEKKTDFFKLVEGDSDAADNQLRVITKPHKYGTHHVKFPDDPNKKFGGGRRVRCAGRDNECELCAAFKAQKAEEEYDGPAWLNGLIVGKMKPRYYLGVIARHADPMIAQVFDCGGLIRGRLKELSLNKKWGDPRNYDITIKVVGGDIPADYYSIDGDPDSRHPMTEEDQALAAKLDIEAMKEKCTPVTNEDLERMVNSYREWIDKALEEAVKKSAKAEKAPAAKASAKPATKAATKPAAKAAPEPEEEEEADDSSSEDSPDYKFKSTNES